MKILTIVGARPQFVKAAVVSRALRQLSDLHEVMVHTGQHYDANMSEIFFQELGIPLPRHHMNVGSGAHGFQTARMLEGIESIIIDEKPDWVVVYGDTNSTLAGALAAAKLHIPLAHVEAGVRSYDRRMPEEVNRVVTDQLATLLFVPTQSAVGNLAQEGIAGPHVVHVGDVMHDATILFGARAKETSNVLHRHSLSPREYLLVTIHRAENTDSRERLTAIAQGIREVGLSTPVIFPLHPRTRAALAKFDLLDSLQAVCNIIQPVGYLDMLRLQQAAKLIVTDSGGVQKEGYFAGVECVVLRDTTEWPELVEAGWNWLVPPGSAEDVANGIRSRLSQAPQHPMPDIFGDGRAAEKIAVCIRNGI